MTTTPIPGRVHSYEGPRPEDLRERINDPSIKSNLPTNMLLALGNCHVNLQAQVMALKEVLDEVGWPDRDDEELFDFNGPPLGTGLDFARENARLTWVLCGLVSLLRQSLGHIERDPSGEIMCFGPCERCAGGATLATS